MGYNNMHDAVQSIGKMVGIDGLAPNSGGCFELIMNDVLPVYFNVVDDDTLEVSVRLPLLEHQLNGAVMEGLMAANGTEAEGRLSVEPGTERVLFGSRIFIGQYDEEGLSSRLNAFAQSAAAWAARKSRALLEMPATQGSGDVLSDTAIRI